MRKNKDLITTDLNLVSNLPEIEFIEHPFIENRKDNYLPNQIVVSKVEFNRIEQKLFDLFVNQIDWNIVSKDRGLLVKIPMSHIKQFMTKQQALLAAMQMIKKSITLVDINHPEIDFKTTSIFMDIESHKKNGEFLQIKTNPSFSPYLLTLGNQYTRYDFKTALSFKSMYATPMYRLLKLHIGQNRFSFTYSIKELRKILNVKDNIYLDLANFKKYVLEPVRLELSKQEFTLSTPLRTPIQFEYEHSANKQRNVTHFQFRIITALQQSQIEKQELSNAVLINPRLVQSKIAEILVKNYNFKKNIMDEILRNPTLNNRFITLHIEFENGLYPKVKNKSAYILTCLGLVKRQ
jgi:hypothetical protein